MSVKREALYILEQNRDRNISGGEMAGALGVSRTAVWKAVNALRSEGYRIEAVTNRGYRLMADTDVLSAEGVIPHLSEDLRHLDIRVYKEVDSTNQEAKRVALNPSTPTQGDGAVVLLTESQTKGKGRMGRGFHSPKQSGLYMSVLLRNRMEAANAVLVTTAAAVAVCRAIRAKTPKEPVIKWVNDVFLDGKKICGILTEAVSDCETGGIENIVVGIGVNFHVKSEELPDDLRDVVGSLYAEGEAALVRNELAAEILNQFFPIYNALPRKDFLADYKRWSLVLGQPIRFLEVGKGTGANAPDGSGDWVLAKAVDVDEDGGLVVELAEGGTRVLRTGEISIRMIPGPKGHAMRNSPWYH